MKSMASMKSGMFDQTMNSFDNTFDFDNTRGKFDLSVFASNKTDATYDVLAEQAALMSDIHGVSMEKTAKDIGAESALDMTDLSINIASKTYRVKELSWQETAFERGLILFIHPTSKIRPQNRRIGLCTLGRLAKS